MNDDDIKRKVLRSVRKVRSMLYRIIMLFCWIGLGLSESANPLLVR